MFNVYLISFSIICSMFYFKLSFIIKRVYNVLALFHMLNIITVASTLNSDIFHYFLPGIHLVLIYCAIVIVIILFISNHPVMY